MSKTVCPGCGYWNRTEKFNCGRHIMPLPVPWLDYVDREVGKMLAAGAAPDDVLNTNGLLLVADESPRVKMDECPNCKRLLVFKNGDIVRVYALEPNARVQVPTQGDLLDLFPEPPDRSEP